MQTPLVPTEQTYIRQGASGHGWYTRHRPDLASRVRARQCAFLWLLTVARGLGEKTDAMMIYDIDVRQARQHAACSSSIGIASHTA